MTRRSLLGSLAALLASAAWPLRSLTRVRRPCYRGSMRGRAPVVLRPDRSRLEPLPLVLVESPPLLWTTKYTPRPYPVSGFAWGPIRADLGRTQLAAAVLADYIGTLDLAGGVLLGKFATLFSEFPPDTSWRLPLPVRRAARKLRPPFPHRSGELDTETVDFPASPGPACTASCRV